MKCKEENLCLVVLALGFLQTCSGAHLKVENKEHMSNNDLVAAPIEKRQNIESGTTRTSRQQRWPFIIYGGCSPYPPWKATPPQAFWGNQRAVPSNFCAMMANGCLLSYGAFINCEGSGPSPSATCNAPISSSFDNSCTFVPGCSLETMGLAHVCTCRG